MTSIAQSIRRPMRTNEMEIWFNEFEFHFEYDSELKKKNYHKN